MSEINYCQNLWAQFAKVDQAQKICAGVMDLANDEGGIHVPDLTRDIALLEKELQKMREDWDGAFVTLEDGGTIFGPEYEELERIAEKTKLDISRVIEMGKISGGHLVDMNFYALNFLVGVHPELRISDFSNLPIFGSLEGLVLSNAEIDDLSPLRKLPNLKELYLGSTRVSDFSALGDFTNLTVLWLHHTAFSDSDIDVLSNLAGLRNIDMSDTRITNISNMEKMIALRYIAVSRTQVADLSPIMDLPNLETVKIYGTPAARDQAEQINTLRQRGVTVEAEA